MLRSQTPWVLLLCAAAASASAQEPAPAPPRAAAAATAELPDTAGVDAIVARALAVHPSIHAAEERVRAARARVAPAGTWPDPMLMAGIQNFPLSDPGFGDFMTMKMVGVSQTVPHPRRLRLRVEVAEREADAAEARLRAARLELGRRARDAYHELAWLDQALEVLARNQSLLAGFIRVTESRYGVGTGTQAEVLKARVETAALAEQAAVLAEQRRVAQARLNETLDRYSETPLPPVRMPARITALAAPASAGAVRFVSPALGARAAGSPLPPLLAVEEMAVANSPLLAEHQAMVQAAAARVELARLEVRPDVDVSLQYGQRDGMPDMVSASVAVPLPVRRGRRQDEGVAEARAELAAAEAARHQARNAVRLEAARLHSELERDRTQLALYVGSIIPQARAALESAAAGFQVGRVELMALLDAQAALFTYETEYHRLLADFARTLAELERVVGKEIAP
ncbi:MAG: TolC family protein [Gemmatimonadetes bacterium]|nr:TolC family protein [Gemmatimonadota bacterium]